MSLFSELKRRQVFRVGAAYLLTAWLVIQVVETIFPAFGFGADAVRVVTIGFTAGLAPVLIAAWLFRLTPEGVRRQTVPVDVDVANAPVGKWLDRIILLALILAVAVLAFELARSPVRDVVDSAPDRDAPSSGATFARSIVVLPFVNMSGDPGKEYFSDGISEELLNLLSRIRDLRVISRTSAFSYKGKEVKVGQIAEELNVSHVLEGSVRQSGSQVRITAQLIDARTDTHLWSRTWDRQLDDIFAIQDELAASVVSELELTLAGEAQRTPETVPEAYALFLQARSVARLGSAESYTEALTLFERVLALDSGYLPAWDGVSGIRLNQANKGLLPFEEGMALARVAAEKALSVDAQFGPAHARLGWIAMLRDNDLALAAWHYQRALALDPGNDRIIGNATALLKSLGRLDDCVTLDEWAIARDPVNPVSRFNLGGSYLYSGRLDDAIEAYRATLRLSPGRLGVPYHMGMAYLLKGDYAAALASMQQEPLDVLRLTGEAMAQHALGQVAEADRIQQQLVDRHGQDAAYNIAYLRAYRGDADGTFVWLEKAAAEGDPGLTDVGVEMLFDNVRDDPRWLPFLRSVGRSPEQLAAIEFSVVLPGGL
ncbi:MAG: tetratricopeptide repeat protein [Pseudomonadales bacterium]